MILFAPESTDDEIRAGEQRRDGADASRRSPTLVEFADNEEGHHEGSCESGFRYDPLYRPDDWPRGPSSPPTIEVIAVNVVWVNDLFPST